MKYAVARVRAVLFINCTNKPLETVLKLRDRDLNIARGGIIISFLQQEDSRRNILMLPYVAILM